ncbi:transposase, partial [Limosilactobacillus fermentum]
GRVEGINRMIKLIQRTAYGFTKFGHFIARIRLHQMETEAEKRGSTLNLVDGLP